MIVAFAVVSLLVGIVIDYLNVDSKINKLTGLPSNYGLVGLAMIFNLYILMYLGVQVGKARKKYGVEYPNMYADPAHCKEPKMANMFNCIQRAHQNSLEQQPAFLTTVALASMKYPLVAGVSAFIMCLGRLAYAAGYSSGDPKKRMNGAFGYIGFLALLGCSQLVVLDQLGFDLMAKFK